MIDQLTLMLLRAERLVDEMIDRLGQGQPRIGLGLAWNLALSRRVIVAIGVSS